jgi:hypothetical protein
MLLLADVSVECGDDSSEPLPLTAEAIAEKFVQYYWRQAMQYPAAKAATVLRQNIGQQAAIPNIVLQARQQHGDSIVAMMNQRAGAFSLPASRQRGSGTPRARRSRRLC